MSVKDFFDPEHVGWVFVLAPAIVVAAAINLDNRFRGPYFAIVDVVFSDFGSGYSWHDREILNKLLRRATYVAVTGAVLNFLHYRLVDIAGVFLVAGFLAIWPAFARPLPIPARKSDGYVLLVWGLYIASIVLFGLFGAKLGALIRALSGQDPWTFFRGNLAWAVIYGIGAVVVTAFRGGLQEQISHRPGGLNKRTRDR